MTFEPSPFRLSNCPECAYDLTGSPQPGRCAECGWVIDGSTIEIPILRTSNGASHAARATDVISLIAVLFWLIILPLGLFPILWWLSPARFIGWLGVAWIVGRIARLAWHRTHQTPRPVLMSTSTALFVQRGTTTIARYPWRLFEHVQLSRRMLTGRLVLTFHDSLGPNMAAELGMDVATAARARDALAERITAARDRGASRSEVEVEPTPADR